jgi:hypothetical protein
MQVYPWDVVNAEAYGVATRLLGVTDPRRAKYGAGCSRDRARARKDSSCSRTTRCRSVFSGERGM